MLSILSTKLKITTTIYGVYYSLVPRSSASAARDAEGVSIRSIIMNCRRQHSGSYAPASTWYELRVPQSILHTLQLS